MTEEQGRLGLSSCIRENSILYDCDKTCGMMDGLLKILQDIHTPPSHDIGKAFQERPWRQLEVNERVQGTGRSCFQALEDG